MADAPLPERRRKRYSLTGSIGFERHINADQRRVAEQVVAVLPPDQFRALLLCGSYGRGEGVRLRDRNGREIADEYEYGIVLGRTDAVLRGAVRTTLDRLAVVLRAATGVAIRFRVFREERLRPAELSYALADLRWSGRVLRGDPTVLDGMTKRPFEHMARGEILWLMVRHGRGLLRNQERLRVGTSLTQDERLWFFRNLIKAILFCGDVRLAIAGGYHPGHQEKLARLDALDQRHHRKFMTLYRLAHRAYGDLDIGEFSEGHPLDWQARVVWLWLDALRRFEHFRRGRALPSWEDYCRPRLEKGQHVGRHLFDNLSTNLEAFGFADLRRHPLWSVRHPRERLIGTLPLLLSGPQTSPEPAGAAALALPPGASWPDTLSAFQACCDRFC